MVCFRCVLCVRVRVCLNMCVVVGALSCDVVMCCMCCAWLLCNVCGLFVVSRVLLSGVCGVVMLCLLYVWRLCVWS